MQLEKKVGRIAFFREIIHGSDKLVSGGPATKQWQQKLNWLFPKLTKYSRINADNHFQVVCFCKVPLPK